MEKLNLTQEEKLFIEATAKWIQSQKTIVLGLSHDISYHQTRRDHAKSRLEAEEKYLNETFDTFKQWCEGVGIEDPLEVLEKFK